MNESYCFYLSNSIDPCYNLALEEYILTTYTQGSYFLLWQNANTIVVGLHQNAIEEINQRFVQEHDISVVRRTTGGGAVYHDLGNLNYSFITDYHTAESTSMSTFMKPVTKVLADMGIAAEFTGRNDVTIDGKKVSGSAQRIYKNRILHHGCLLFDADLSMVSQALQVKDDKFKSKAVKSVRARVANIKDYLPPSFTMNDFKEQILKSISADNHEQALVLTPEDKQAILKLKKERYDSWDWTFGKSPLCSVHNYRKFPVGSIDVYLDTDNGLIQEITIFGDFLALRPVTDITSQLINCPYTFDAVLAVLKRFPLSEYFGNISEEEIAACICCLE